MREIIGFAELVGQMETPLYRTIQTTHNTGECLCRVYATKFTYGRKRSFRKQMFYRVHEQQGRFHQHQKPP